MSLWHIRRRARYRLGKFGNLPKTCDDFRVSKKKKDHREQEKQIIMHKDKGNGIVMMIKWKKRVETFHLFVIKEIFNVVVISFMQ
jgi:hypothetical protein